MMDDTAPSAANDSGMALSGSQQKSTEDSPFWTCLLMPRRIFLKFNSLPGHGYGIHGTVACTEPAAQAGLLLLEKGMQVLILRPQGFTQGQAVRRAVLDTDGTGHAQPFIDPGFLPLRAFHHAALPAVLIEHGTLRAYPSACPTVQTLGLCYDMPLFLFPGYGYYRADLGTGLTTITCIRDRV